VIRIGLILSLAAAALLLAGPLGTRVGLWPFLIGFLMLALSLLLGLSGASLSLVGGLKTGQWSLALASIIVGLAVVSVPSAVILSARGKPPIHDITTDMENPPPFVAVLPLRAGAANPPDYAGTEVAAQQRRAYPDIQPLVLRAPAGDVFDRALSVIRELGWEVVASDRTAGRVEAVDTTFWFGFKDDVVIRIAGQPDGTTRVDVRSTSRVGVGDVGTNARRIRTLLDRMRAAS
jgi:uncharacterized protein (DUF1499 family)